jgi:MtN3 and saliva related transmembrane protein
LSDLKTEIIGWAAAIVLLLTIGKRVHKQWRDQTSEGISKWLFAGQVTASFGFSVYSFLLKN